MSAISDEANELLSRMHALRSTGDRDVQRLQDQMDRVTDWREHVRARPALSAAVAAVVGFTVVRAVLAQPSRQTTSSTPASAAPAANSATNVQEKRSATRSVLAFAGGMASTFLRQWISEYIKKELKVGQHGFAESRSHERSSPYS